MADLMEGELLPARYAFAMTVADIGAPMGSNISLTIIFRGKRRTMDYVAGDTVLGSARRAGLNPPFSCEAGNCATCMALLKEGSVTMRANKALEPDEVEEGFILTCQSIPDCDSVVDYDSL